MNLFLALISLGFITAPPAFAGTVSPLPYTIENAPIIIEAYAVRYGIPAKPLIRTLQCESGFDPDGQSNYYHNGLREQSWGVAQINLPYHLDLTKEEALNPFFAIDWAAQQFAAGNQRIWSCYRQLYPKGYKGG